MTNSLGEGRSEHFLFVVDTDTYTGNFEREFCAYVTGQIGECNVGVENAGLAGQEVPEVVAQLEELVEMVPDDKGCHRPVSTFPNPKYGNDGKGNHVLITEKNKKQFPWPAHYSVAIYFHSIPHPILLDAMKQRARYVAQKRVGFKRCGTPITIEGFRLLEKQVSFRELSFP